MSMVDLAPANGINVVFSSVMPVCDYIKPQTERRPPEQIVALKAWMKDDAASGRPEDGQAAQIGYASNCGTTSP